MHGDGAAAAFAAVCIAEVADEVILVGWQPLDGPATHELPANGWRLLQALGLREAVEKIAYFPLADLHRSASSGYLLSQRPLQQFARDRYGFAHAVVEEGELAALLLDAAASRGVRTSSAVVTADLQLTNRRANRRTNAADATPWQRTVYHTERDESDRNQRFLTRWLAASSYATCLPTLHGQTVEILAARAEPWHARLIGKAQPALSATLALHAPAAHWFRGADAVFGAAGHASLPISGLGLAAALEDAWVLARMLDNYDDHLPTALAEYETYRGARARRLHAYEQRSFAHNLQSPRILTRNLKLAFSSRFLPEMAMQKLDWMYGYDAVKGFR